MHFAGMVYRALTPYWSSRPLSGNGASLHGGRFNPIGTPTLYTSLTAVTALAEYHQGFPHRPQPTTLCAYSVDCKNIVDISDPKEQARYGVTASDIATDWEFQIIIGNTPVTWVLAEKMIQNNIAGIIAPSFTVNTTPDARNLILWKWGDEVPHQVLVIDHDDRLPKTQSSWE